MGIGSDYIKSEIADFSKVTLGSGIKGDKCHPIVDFIGIVYELNSWIGVTIALSTSKRIKDILNVVQHDLSDLTAQVNVPGTPLLSSQQLKRIEVTLAELDSDFGTFDEIILPGGSPSAAFSHVARSVCWRAERDLARLINDNFEVFPQMGFYSIKDDVAKFGFSYLKRLSDLLLVVSRIESRREGKDDFLVD